MDALEIFLDPWESLVERFDVLRTLRDCRQDPVFHAEGDVFIHTRLVLGALESLDAWQNLDPRGRAIVRAAALFHDIGKPAKTIVGDDGRVSSRNHALKGAQIVRSLLYRDVPLAFEDREAIANLVLLHSLPALFLEKPDPQRSVIRASLAVNCYWLSLVATADALGRTCTEVDGARTNHIQMFRDYCEENGCLHAPRQFPSDFSRLQYFRGRDSLEFGAYDDCVCDVVLLSGLPAAGKDTLVAERYSSMPVISLDSIRAEMHTSPEAGQGEVIAQARDQARRYLRTQSSFVWNATNISRSLRGLLVGLFCKYSARVKIVYVESPYDAVLKRNRARPSPVPVSVIDALTDKLEVPQYDEAVTVEYVIHRA